MLYSFMLPFFEPLSHKKLRMSYLLIKHERSFLGLLHQIPDVISLTVCLVKSFELFRFISSTSIVFGLLMVSWFAMEGYLPHNCRCTHFLRLKTHMLRRLAIWERMWYQLLHLMPNQVFKCRKLDLANHFMSPQDKISWHPATSNNFLLTKEIGIFWHLIFYWWPYIRIGCSETMAI